MSDLMSAIYDDVQEYLNLCEYYGVKPEVDDCGTDPYCNHADELKKRYREEFKIKSKGILVIKNV